MGSNKHLDERAHALYRFFGSGGTLLYIGITNSIPVRLKKHSADKPWWTGVNNITVEHFPNRPAVLEAERRAIIAEKPLYNDQHNQAGRWPDNPTGRGTTDAAEMETWRNLYFELAGRILSYYPDFKRDEYLALAHQGFVKEGDSSKLWALDSPLLQGPAAFEAFHDVYTRLSDLVDLLQQLVGVMPEARSAFRSASTEITEAGGDLVEMPWVVLRHMVDQAKSRDVN